MNANNIISFPEGNIVRRVKTKESEDLGIEFTNNKKLYLDTLTEHYSTKIILNPFFIIIYSKVK